MDKPGYRYALSALRDKRSGLAGEIAALRRRIAQCEADMAHIDASLLLLAPAANPATLPVKRFQKRVKLFKQGQLGRLILGVLRRSKRPLSTHEIADALGQDGGFDGAVLARRVRGNLAYLERSGRINKLSRARNARWAVIDHLNSQWGLKIVSGRSDLSLP